MYLDRAIDLIGLRAPVPLPDLYDRHKETEGRARYYDLPDLDGWLDRALRPPRHAAIAEESVGAGNAAARGDNPVSWSHTIGGNDRCILIFIGSHTWTSDNHAVISDVEVDGVAASFVRKETNSYEQGEIWRLVAPNTGTVTVEVSASSMPGGATITGQSVNFTGVDQSTPISNTAGFADFGNPASITCSSDTDELVVDFVACAEHLSSNHTPGTGQTTVFGIDNSDTGAAGFSCTKKSGASPNVDMERDFPDTTRWAQVAVSLKPAAGGATVTPTAIDSIARTVDPTTIKGSISISPTERSSIARTVNPTVVKGSIVLTPTAIDSIARTVDPTVDIGGAILTPSAISAIARTVDTTPVKGSISLSPAAIASIGNAVIGAAIKGSMTISPGVIESIARTVDPTTIKGSASIVPAAIKAVCRRANPTVIGDQPIIRRALYNLQKVLTWRW